MRGLSTSALVASLLENGAEPREVVTRFLQLYVPDNGGVKACRHGGCVELVESFMGQHADAEMWEAIEAYGDYGLPLVASKDQINRVRQKHGAEFLEDLGSMGTHAVCVWQGLVFDAAGVSSFEEITRYFNLKPGRDFWARTA